MGLSRRISFLLVGTSPLDPVAYAALGALFGIGSFMANISAGAQSDTSRSARRAAQRATALRPASRVLHVGYSCRFPKRTTACHAVNYARVGMPYAAPETRLQLEQIVRTVGVEGIEMRAADDVSGAIR